MPLFPGLLISTKRNFEKNAESEMHFLLSTKLEIDKSKFVVKKARVSGLVTVNLLMEPHEIDALMERIIHLEDENSFFINTLKIRPIHHVIDSDLDLLHHTEMSLPEGVKFKVTIGKRHTEFSSEAIINAVASKFDNPVDLEHPDMVVLIEVLADFLGYAIIPPRYIFTTSAAKAMEEKKNDLNWFLD